MLKANMFLTIQGLNWKSSVPDEKKVMECQRNQKLALTTDMNMPPILSSTLGFIQILKVHRGSSLRTANLGIPLDFCGALVKALKPQRYEV